MSDSVGSKSVGRKPIPVNMKRSERACAMFTKGEIKKIEKWMSEQEFHLTLSDALRALALKAIAEK